MKNGFVRRYPRAGKNTRKKSARTGKFYVNIVECADGTYYTGSTNNIEKRVDEHNKSRRAAKYTRSRRPVTLVWAKGYGSFGRALSKERRIKALTRKKKELLAANFFKKQVCI